MNEWVRLRAENIRLTRRCLRAERLCDQAAGLFRLLTHAYPQVSAPRHWLDQYDEVRP